MNGIDCDGLITGSGASPVCEALAAVNRGARVCMAVKGKFGTIGLQGAVTSSCEATEKGLAAFKSAVEYLEGEFKKSLEIKSRPYSSRPWNTGTC